MTTASHTAAPRLVTGAAGERVWQTRHPQLGHLEITVLDPDADLDLIHGWVTAPTARFWGLAALPREELRDLYAYVDELPTHHAFILRRDGLPIVLLQTYEPDADPLGDAYESEPGDVGIHFLLADRGAPVRGFTTHVGDAISAFVFSQPGATRIVVEPDVDNERAVARTRVFGFELGPHVDLPGKTGQLAFLTRQRWEHLCAGRA